MTNSPVIPASKLERIYRSNFVYFMADNLLFSVAISIIGSTTVIPDFIRHLTSSEILIGLSGSLFTVGYTLPQLFVARHIVRYERKKWWFVGPNIPVRFMILIFAGIVAWLGNGQPGLILTIFFVIYTIAAFGDGLVGVPWTDLAATSLDDRWRARMLGITAAVSGVILLAIAPLVGLILGERGPGFPNNYAVLFGIAGVLFAISTLPGLFIHELPGGKAVEKLRSFGEFFPELGHVLRTDGPFRAFILLRVLTSLFMMAAPFYIGFATIDLGLSSQVAVPIMLAMQTAGGILGALVYTRIGAHNNMLYIRLAMGSAVLLPLCALLAGVVGPLPLYFGLLVSGLAATINLLSCYVNWVVNYAHHDQRPVYVGLSNTIAAVASFIAPIIGGALAQYMGYRPLFVVSLVIAVIALFVSIRFLRATPAEESSAAIGESDILKTEA
jgi:MFS family permease